MHDDVFWGDFSRDGTGLMATCVMDSQLELGQLGGAHWRALVGIITISVVSSSMQ